MLSGKITLDTNNQEPFKNIISAHSNYVELGTVETDTLKICIIVGKVRRKHTSYALGSS